MKHEKYWLTVCRLKIFSVWWSMKTNEDMVGVEMRMPYCRREGAAGWTLEFSTVLEPAGHWNVCIGCFLLPTCGHTVTLTSLTSHSTHNQEEQDRNNLTMTSFSLRGCTRHTSHTSSYWFIPQQALLYLDPAKRDCPFSLWSLICLLSTLVQ